MNQRLTQGVDRRGPTLPHRFKKHSPRENKPEPSVPVGPPWQTPRSGVCAVIPRNPHIGINSTTLDASFGGPEAFVLATDTRKATFLENLQQPWRAAAACRGSAVDDFYSTDRAAISLAMTRCGLSASLNPCRAESLADPRLDHDHDEWRQLNATLESGEHEAPEPHRSSPPRDQRRQTAPSRSARAEVRPMTERAVEIDTQRFLAAPYGSGGGRRAERHRRSTEHAGEARVCRGRKFPRRSRDD